MINTQTVKVNLIKQDYTTAFILNQGDKGVPVKIELIDDGTPYILQKDDIVTIEWLKPNGSSFLQEGGIKYGTNSIEFTTPEAIAQCNGSGSFNIIISNGDLRKGTIRREYKVIPTSFKPGSVSEDVITDAITELRELSVEIADTVQNNQEIINSNTAATKSDIASVNSSLDNYVTKISGKGLSTNDFTNAYKTALDSLTATISKAILESKKALYPVGSLYFNATREANPGTLLGFGTWERIAQGKTLIGVDTEDTDFNTVGKTGGSKIQTLSIAQLPQNLYLDASTNDGSSNKWVREEQGTNWCNRINWHRNNASQESVSIMQPYLTVYIWKRTA